MAIANMMDEDDIEQRIAALRATAVTNGAKAGRIAEFTSEQNTKVTNIFAGAISHVELLGAPEADMTEHFGERQRRSIFTDSCGN